MGHLREVKERNAERTVDLVLLKNFYQPTAGEVVVKWVLCHWPVLATQTIQLIEDHLIVYPFPFPWSMETRGLNQFHTSIVCSPSLPIPSLSVLLPLQVNLVLGLQGGKKVCGEPGHF